jgi:uncharacterized protein (DUF1800 family)
MSLGPKAKAALALHRFGLGPRAGSIKAIASDPRGALVAELDRPDAGRISHPTLRTSGAAMRAAFDVQQALKVRPEGTLSKPNFGPGTAQQIYLDEAEARIHAAFDAEIGFVERLVWFWSNHFCVSADKGNLLQICGAYERETIRANVLGSFGDMLLAVESHPAMLIYLDNILSIGPNSSIGMRYRRGLNENLAREVLELHTLGARDVYTQEDVAQFAAVMTGWTVIGPTRDPAHGGEFVFNPQMHQPGPQVVIGTRYPDGGMEQGRAVLAALARHPATARHVTAKLARHFITDAPPTALVERLARRFLDTEGNLKEVAKALVTAPEAWETPRTKLKRPGEWIVGALRAVDAEPSAGSASKSRSPGSRIRTAADVQPVMQAQDLLGEPLWRPPAPKGFADESTPWLDGLAQRVDIANQLAQRVAAQVDPRAVFEEVLAPLASPETRRAAGRAESRPQALALLFMAPEFQRR